MIIRVIWMFFWMLFCDYLSDMDVFLVLVIL